MRLIHHLAIAYILAAPTSWAAAEEDSKLLAKAGTVLFEDDFSRSEMKPKWDVGMGFWTIKDGVVTVAQNPADHHGAYAFIDPRIDYKDIVAEFSFKFDGARNVQLNMGDSRDKEVHAGHILRVEIMPKGVELVDMKMGEMKMENYRVLTDPKATPAEKREVRKRIQDKTADFKAGFGTDWHQARVEVIGDEMLVIIDGKVAAYIKSEGIGHPTKNMLGFTIREKSVSIKDVKFREGTAVPGWPEKRAEALAGLQKDS